MMARGIEQHFVDWVKSQPADREYAYAVPTGCAFAVFLNENGYAKQAGCGGSDWGDRAILNGADRHPIPSNVARALVAEPYSFGALASRLAEAA